MEPRNPKRTFIKPEVKRLEVADSLGKMSFGRQVTPKKQYSSVKGANNTSESKRSPELGRLQRQNSVLHQQNLKLLRQIKSLSGIKGESIESSYIEYTDRKHNDGSPIRGSKIRGEYENQTTIKGKKRMVTEQSPIVQTYQKEIAYLLRCIQEREGTIEGLQNQLDAALSNREAKMEMISNAYKRQLEQKQQTIKGLMKRLEQAGAGDTNEIFQVKKQNYKLKLKINQLTHEVATHNQQRQQMQSIICQLYFDNQIRSQESELVSDVQYSCEKTRNHFQRIIRGDSN